MPRLSNGPPSRTLNLRRCFASMAASPATRKVNLGVNKSMIVELPRPVRDVMVSNPKLIDAVLQTSTRVYIAGMSKGEANVFFIDKDGKQILTLEVNIDRDLTALGDLLNQLIPSSRISRSGRSAIVWCSRVP